MPSQQRERYSRQMLFAPIGEDGQELLDTRRVLVVGVGALGTVIANHLIRAGVGYVRLVDRDYVEESNLQRQMLFDEEDVRRALPKAVAAEEKLTKINSAVTVEGIVADVTIHNIHELLEGIDLVLDGTDNFRTRFLLNDACFAKGIPFVYGGAVSSRGMTALFIPEKTPCLRCFIDEGQGTGQTCDTVGVIAPVVDLVASLQTIEALKWLTNNEEAIRQSLVTFDAWRNHHYSLRFSGKKQGCPTCDLNEYPALKEREEDEATTLCGRETVQIRAGFPFDLQATSERLQSVAQVQLTPFLVNVQLQEGERLVVFQDGRVLVQGTEDLVRAKTLVGKYLGV